MTDHTCAIYFENKTKLSWLIWKGTVYEEKEIGQQRDRLYRYDLDQKWN